MINLDDRQSKGTYWVSLFIDRNTAVHFDFFQIEYFPQEILSKIKDKSITYNIFRIQSDDSIMSAFCYTAFIGYLIACQIIPTCFLLMTIKRIGKIMYKYFKEKQGKPCLQTKKIDETRNHLSEEIKHTDLMSEKHKKFYRI